MDLIQNKWYYKNNNKKKKLLSASKFYFWPANFTFNPQIFICGKYMQFSPWLSEAKGGHFGRVWNKSFF